MPADVLKNNNGRKMSSPLDQAREVLNDLERDLERSKALWDSMREVNPNFEQLSDRHWIQRRNRSWLHGATELHERNELERWLYDVPPITARANSSAIAVYNAWRKWLNTSGIPKWNIGYDYDKKTHQLREVQAQELGETYYAGDRRFKIQRPLKGETLLAFVMRLAQELEDSGRGHRLEWRALKSFLEFVRSKYPKEEVAFIEHIFPQKMDLHCDRIIRLIPPEAYPISERTAAEISMELARRCRTGRPDACHTAAESLGLFLLCVTASRLRLPTHVETIFSIKTSAVQKGERWPLLQVPTWFGDRPVHISHRWAAFLNALFRIPSKEPRETILQRPLRSLTRTFDVALQSVNPNPEYGNITYLSLLNQPHIFDDHRPQPKH